jgi:hypothetical protein
VISIGSATPGSFLAVASKSNGTAREPKICEGWRCGRLFFRRVPVGSHTGETLCPGCRRKEDLRSLRKGIKSDR